MNALAKVTIAIILVGGLAVGGFAAFHKKAVTVAGQNTGSQLSSVASNAASTAKIAATITFTDNGFSPAVTTVKVGDTVRVTNKSNQPVQFDSDPHPQHTDEPELNVGEVDPGQSQTFTVTKAGHWGFHDHLDASFTGTLNVE